MFSLCCACLRCSCISRIFCNQPTAINQQPIHAKCAVYIYFYIIRLNGGCLCDGYWIFSPLFWRGIIFLYPKLPPGEGENNNIRSQTKNPTFQQQRKKMKNNLVFHQHFRSNNMKTSRVPRHLEKNVVEIRYNRPSFSSTVWWPSCSQQQQHGAAED